MKRSAIVALSLAVVALAGGGYWLSTWAYDTCQPLDRMFGPSGCTGTITITNFVALQRDTMSVERPDGTAALVGWGRNDAGEDTAPMMVQVDLANGREIDRMSLVAGNKFDHAVFSPDGERALLTCRRSSECVSDDGHSAIVISTRDGSRIEVVEAWVPYPRLMPDVPEPGEGFSLYAMFANNGQTVVDVNNDEDVILYSADGSMIATLMTVEERQERFAPRFIISPQQSRVALMLRSRPEVGDGFAIWSAVDGTPVATMLGTKDYTSSSSPSWSADETAMFFIRREQTSTLIDRFSIEPLGR
nr:hypothetical protein [uncultured Devosia sp.]